MTNQPRIEGTIEIDAPPADVWKVIADLKRMGEWSPQCRSMKVFGGDVKLGTRTFNWNEQGTMRWPTTAKVTAFEPYKKLAFRITQNRTVWTYELEPTATGTTVTESRTAPTGVSGLSNMLSKRFLGGTEEFESGLKKGIDKTLQRIKAEVEA